MKDICSAMALLALVSTSYAEESPGAILEHTRAVYIGLTSYADTGTVRDYYSPTAYVDYTFSTAYNGKPRHFLLDFRNGSGGRIVIWADPDAFHVWWKTTGQVTEYPNPKNSGALTLSDYTTKAVSTKIPALLFGKAALPGTFLNFVPARGAGLEDCGEKKCHRLEGEASDVYAATGKTVNVRKLTVWIESDVPRPQDGGGSAGTGGLLQPHHHDLRSAGESASRRRRLQVIAAQVRTGCPVRDAARPSSDVRFSAADVFL